MKKVLFKFALIISSIMMITGCNPINDAKDSLQGQIVLDNDYVRITAVSNRSRVTTIQKQYTKEDWAYSTTTVTFDDDTDTTEFYSKDSSIKVECKKEGNYSFISTAYKADKTTAIAKTLPQEKNVTFEDGDFTLNLVFTDILTYEEIDSVTGTIVNQWGEETSQLSDFLYHNGWRGETIKTIRFIKEPYTDEYTEKWSGGTNVEVYYNENDCSMTVTSNGLKMYAPSSCCELFQLCKNLESIDFSNFDTSNVECMLGMFGGCEKLTHIDVSTFDTSKVTDMSRMFYDCDKLESLDLSNFDTSKVTDMQEMFAYCDCLNSVNLSSFDTSNVTNMSHMFCICNEKFTDIDLTSFDTHNVISCSDMFCDCHEVNVKVDNNKWTLTKEQISGWAECIIFN